MDAVQSAVGHLRTALAELEDYEQDDLPEQVLRHALDHLQIATLRLTRTGAKEIIGTTACACRGELSSRL